MPIQGCAIRKKQVLAKGLVAISNLLAQDSQLLAKELPYICRAYKSWVFSVANLGEFIDFRAISRYQFLPNQIMDCFPIYRHYVMNYWITCNKQSDIYNNNNISVYR